MYRERETVLYSFITRAMAELTAQTHSHLGIGMPMLRLRLLVTLPRQRDADAEKNHIVKEKGRLGKNYVWSGCSNLPVRKSDFL